MFNVEKTIPIILSCNDFFLKGDDLIFKIKNYLINIQNALAKVKIHVDIRNVRLFRPHLCSISEI